MPNPRFDIMARLSGERLTDTRIQSKTMSKLFPSILPSGDDFVDDKYSREELKRKDWQELRGLAKEHPSDEINGHSEKEEVIDFLTGEERL